MSRDGKLRVALIWAQYAAYHVDRCEAVARRLAGRAEVIAIEVATTSTTYAWEPSGEVAGARKITLFPGRSFDSLGWFARYRAMLAHTRHADVTMIGLSYGEPDAIALAWTLRLLGKRVVVFSESKFDDLPRHVLKELSKAALLACYTAAIVGGQRHREYFGFLGFRRRAVLPGYDGVSVDRIKAQGGEITAASNTSFQDRPFVFVGRFVDKKNLLGLIEGYALYVAGEPVRPRRLVLVGSGEEEGVIRALLEQRGLTGLVDLPGFLSAEAVSHLLPQALCLMLVSREEQWGLVVNEALAVGLPVIVSNQVGSRDALVRNLVNGFVVEAQAPSSIAAAMRAMGADESAWTEMVEAARARAWLGDTERLADAVEVVLGTATPAVHDRLAQFLSEMELTD